MKKQLLFSLLLFFSANSLAEILPALPSQEKASPHKFFVTSQTLYGESFDTWQFDGGYAYSIFDSVDLYVGAHVNTTNSQSLDQNGFLSGISYQFNDTIELKSTLRSRSELQESGERESVYTAEVSSRVRLSDNLDLHATLDYEEWQQGFEVGLGFSF